jgi:radical SAM protein with 4Fe4S-binding SPASM domain
MSLTKENATPENLASEMASITSRLNIDKLSDSRQFPQYFQIETTRHCNAHCPFCAVDEWDMSHPKMSDYLYDKIIEEVSDYSDWVRLFDVQRAGEPLLDVKIAPRIKQAKDAGLKWVTISTNGALLDQSRGSALLEAGIDEVMISIDSVEKDSYEALRVGLNFESVMANIRNFFRLRDDIRPQTRIRIRGVADFDIYAKENNARIEKWDSVWEKLRKNIDRVYYSPPHNWGNTFEWDGHKEQLNSSLDYAPCICPWSTLNVLASGKVPLCSQDTDADIVLGDINLQSIAEVWQSDAFNKIRETHSSGARNEISFCQGCKCYNPEYSLEEGHGDVDQYAVALGSAAE